MKKLHLSKNDKILGGVCGGISESIGINANIIRLIFVISLIFGFSGGWVYIILLVILPKNAGKEEIIDIEEKENNRIFRTWQNRMIAGVCSGIAKYLNWDVSLVRIIFIIMTMAGGIGIILYLFFWFIFSNEE